MSLAASYRLIAPIYDWFIAKPLAATRRASLSGIPSSGSLDVLLDGVGTGLDFAYLPRNHRYIGIDLVGAMLARAQARAAPFDCVLLRADSLALPFADASFDIVVLHLIVAVVPYPERALAEAARVTRPGGTLLVLDKFLRPGQRAHIRRTLSPIAAKIATRLDVEFEMALANVPSLKLQSDVPALACGWFRRIVLEKRATQAAIWTRYRT